MYCKHCGNLIKTGALFCSKCGTKVEPPKNEEVRPKNPYVQKPTDEELKIQTAYKAEDKVEDRAADKPENWKSDMWLTEELGEGKLREEELEEEELEEEELEEEAPVERKSQVRPPKKKGALVKILLIIVLVEILVGTAVYMMKIRGTSEQNGEETVAAEALEEESGARDETMASKETIASKETLASEETQEESSATAETEQESAPQITGTLNYANQVDFNGLSKIAIAQNMVSQSSYLIQQSVVADNTGWSAFDGDTSTSWQEGVELAGIGEYIKADFDREYGVSVVTFFLGNHTSSDWYIRNNRPKRLKVSLGTQVFEVEFPDVMEGYALVFDQPVNADSIRIEIADIYAGNEYDDTIIADIGVYAR